MAWTAYTVGSPENIEQRVGDLEPTGEDQSSELDRQVKAAKKAALAIIKAGAVGGGEAYQVGLSGHANVEHAAPDDPTLNHDNVTVQVTQMPLAVLDGFEAGLG